jgi:hypothetical protein
MAVSKLAHALDGISYGYLIVGAKYQLREITKL